ncbi:hypothetical protein ABFY27_03915 [Akkermansia massiliensis]
MEKKKVRDRNKGIGKEGEPSALVKGKRKPLPPWAVETPRSDSLSSPFFSPGRRYRKKEENPLSFSPAKGRAPGPLGRLLRHPKRKCSKKWHEGGEV